MEVEHCRIVYDTVDRIYIAKSARYPGVRAHGDDAETALRELEFVLCVEDLKKQTAPPGCMGRPFQHEND